MTYGVGRDGSFSLASGSERVWTAMRDERDVRARMTAAKRWTKLSPIMPNIHEAKTHFSKLVQRAAAGEEIIITRSGVPMAKLVPFRETRSPRSPGVWKGSVEVAPDFDATSDEVVAQFEDDE